MISIVCVFNNKQVLEQRLCQSLRRQNCIYDLIVIDNCENKYDSAARALNHGARLATGEWIIFVHQDIEFLSKDWIKNAEAMLNDFNPKGWVGVAGRDDKGIFKGFMVDRSSLFGQLFKGFDQVQTLDECLLIHRRVSDEHRYFDEDVPGWHAYGVDVCCTALASGKKNYVISLPVWHDSPSTNLAGLDHSHGYVKKKHQSFISKIYTTCGILSKNEEQPHSRITWHDRVDFRIKKYSRILFGVNDPKTYTLSEKLESMTYDDNAIDCLHSEYWIETIDACSFIPQPERKRRVRHKYTGLNAVNSKTDCEVIWYDLAGALTDNKINALLNKASSNRIIICLSLKHLWLRPLMWKKIIGRSEYSCLTLDNFDNSPVLIISIAVP